MQACYPSVWDIISGMYEAWVGEYGLRQALGKM
jgi:hypothetical protein